MNDKEKRRVDRYTSSNWSFKLVEGTSNNRIWI